MQRQADVYAAADGDGARAALAMDVVDFVTIVALVALTADRINTFALIWS